MADPQSGFGKSVAAVGAGSLSVIVVYIVNQMIVHPLPAEITAAIQTLITTLAVYLTPHDAIGGS